MPRVAIFVSRPFLVEIFLIHHPMIAALDNPGDLVSDLQEFLGEYSTLFTDAV
jgi:hypothetical protein